LLKIAREVAREREAAEPGLRMDYLRAESARLPLRSGVFDVVAAKDSLHHLIDVEAAFGEAKRVMKPGGAFVADEQVFAAPWIDRLFVTTTLLLRPLILRRHAVGPVPAVLTHPSPLEDRGCHAVLPAFRATFGRRSEAARWLFVDFVEMHAHYAFRKWRWLAGPPLIALAWAIEGTIRLAVGRPLGMGLRGENEP
jgi:SAM-dependent methyltransferase